MSFTQLGCCVLPTAWQLLVRSYNLPPSQILMLCYYQPFACLLQTSADMTLLTQSLPEDDLTPFSVKLHKDSFRAYHTGTPSLDIKVTKDSLLKH